VKQYFYTVASLPALKFEETPFLSEDAFLEMCAVEATPEDFGYIASARIRINEEEDLAPGPGETGVSAEWNRILREFQLQAAAIRAQNLGWEVERLPKPDVQDPTIPERLRQILGEDNPLKRELGVLRWLWNAAESLETGHYFDREKLVLYYLKLQIAQRRLRITDSEAGDAGFDEQYRKVAESLMEIAT
jgi:hypothetical protein